MPEYKAEWVMHLSETEIRRDKDFTGLDESELKSLTQAYFEGYTARFNEFFDDTATIQLGYDLGLRFDPIRDGFYPRPTGHFLKINREKIEKKFMIQSEAEWRFFCKSFNKGFQIGYFDTIENITSKSPSLSITQFE